jgi:SAM-dependent methyltransferase
MFGRARAHAKKNARSREVIPSTVVACRRMSSLDFGQIPPDTISALHDALVAARFDDDLLHEAEGVAPRLLDPVRLPVVHAWLRARDDAGARIARLFAYADHVETAHVDDALGPALRRQLSEHGVLRQSDDGMRATIRIVPLCGLHIASDPMEAAGDPVMGPGAFTLEMAQLMPVTAGDRVLDVGSGAGSLALVAASRGATSVVGIDLHPRAAAVGRFNARLNGLSAEFLTGDLTAPVAGRTFDLVVAQPPFVVKPDEVAATTYLHGGAEGDELALRLCAELPAIVAPGGRGLVLVETLRDAAGIGSRVGQAVGDAPLVTISLVTPGTSRDLLAIGYASIAHPDLGDAYAAAAGHYWRHLAARDATGTLHVLVDIRAGASRTRPVAVRIDRPSMSGLTAEGLCEIEAGVDLALSSDDELLAATVCLAPGGVVTQSQSLGDGEVSLRLRWPEPVRGEQVLSDAASLVVEVAAAPTHVATIAAAYADATGSTVDEVRARVLAFVRGALASGLLVAR